ncbi:16S rRNA (guanine(527)-N(7))-methyltransferase RsmG [Chitinimonas sp. PSY-7]|uniref:16S rRNA (guanine(527)-N(7))-methyltransferase RsmG n=1 Tax=Chitinimonas sp. PSY-7 TaxID=3459088 RepID=UPI00404018E5
MIGPKQEQQLREGLAALSLTFDDATVSRLLTYLALLLKWNKTYSLTAITEPDRMVSHHLLDSLAALSPIAAVSPRRLVDVGSGGGQPGIPFAIVQPQWQITLLDSNHKKTTFLRQAVIELGLENVQVVCDRVENVSAGEGFDLITSRAFADLADFARLTRHLLAEGGHWAALKGVQPFEEVAALPADITSRITPLNVPALGAERCIVWMELHA